MAYNSKTQTFDTSPELRDRVGTNGASVFVLGYYTPGDFGQTIIYTYSENASADDDGGIVFKPDSIDPGAGGRWLLSYSQPVNVLWFGLKADGTFFDNLALYNIMIAALPNIPTVPIDSYNLKGSIYFPRSASTYYFSEKLEITDGIVFLGDDGTDTLMGTVLEFPTDTTGVHIRPIVAGSPQVKGAHSAKFFNIKFQSIIGTDRTKAGMIISRPVHMVNCDFTGFSGNGFTIDTSIEGIADLCYILLCSAYYNGGSGMETAGIDSNQSNIISCNFFGNYRWGVYEHGFLGNKYDGCHTNANSEVTGNPVWAFHNDETYACIQNHTDVEPGVDSGWESYWTIVVLGVHAPTVIYPEWDNTKAYLTGGAYLGIGDVNASLWINCYSEGGQPPSYFAGYNLLQGGVHGAGFRVPKTTASISANLGKLFTYSGFYASPKDTNNSLPTQDLTIDEAGYSIFPIDDTGQREVGVSTSYLWSAAYGAFTKLYANSSPIFFVTTPLFDPSWLGRSASPGGYMNFALGMFLGGQSSFGSSRKVEMGTAIPVSGTYGVGDMVIKIISTGGSTVLGWRCTVAGTPGTWETLNVTIS